MFWFERQVVAALLHSRDDLARSAVEAYVDGALAALPDHIRAGVAAESVLFGGWARLRGGPVDLERLDRSRIGPARQYARLLRSLVLFAEHELEPGAAG